MTILAELPYHGIADVAYSDISHPRDLHQATLCIAEKLTQVHSGERLTKALDLVLTNAVVLNPNCR
jgi:hypothetical protein